MQMHARFSVTIILYSDNEKVNDMMNKVLILTNKVQ